MKKILLTVACLVCLSGCNSTSSKQIEYVEDSFAELSYKIDSKWTVLDETDEKKIYRDEDLNMVVGVFVSEVGELNPSIDKRINATKDSYKYCRPEEYANKTYAACIGYKNDENLDSYTYYSDTRQYEIIFEPAGDSKKDSEDKKDTLLRSVQISNPLPFDQSGSKLLFNPFNEYRFGMSSEEAQDVMKYAILIDPNLLITKYDAVLDISKIDRYKLMKYDCLYILGFLNNKLDMVQISFNPNSMGTGFSLQYIPDEENYYETYEFVKKTLVDAYGEPTEELFDFNDETYKDDLDKSIKYAYLKIYDAWVLDDMIIDLQWGEDTYLLTYFNRQN